MKTCCLDSLIKAVLKIEGTNPMESNILTISRIGQFLKKIRWYCIGSNMQVVGLETVTRLVKASGEIISFKVQKGAVGPSRIDRSTGGFMAIILRAV